MCDMLTDCDKFPVRELCNYPFMPLEKGTKAEISEIWNILITAMQIKYRCYLFRRKKFSEYKFSENLHIL